MERYRGVAAEAAPSACVVFSFARSLSIRNGKLPAMSDATLTRIQQWLEDHQSELLEDTRVMLRVPSVQGDPEPNAPYGAENRRALDLALEKANSWGMRTTDLEGHLGYAEFGSGERLVMALGHLDVVPVGSGWKHDPFGAEIEGDYLYARGATDDKGPTMAMFYAMRALQECWAELPCRLRMAFGCNEESGFGCVKRYAETEEPPTFGLAPDSNWPLYYAEKGIVNFTLRIAKPKGEMEIVEIQGGQRHNIVIDACHARIRVADTARPEIEEKLAGAWDKNVAWNWTENGELSIEAGGKAAHAMWPFGGDSAATRLLRFLMEISPLSTRQAYEELLAITSSSGAGLGIHGSDEPSKDLTNNLGVIKSVNGHLEMLFNVRYPVTWRWEEIRRRLESHLAGLKNEYQILGASDSPPLYFPLEHPMVKAIVEVYEVETGERLTPGVMGGGTYARAIPNTVSIGTGWQGDGEAHETNERLKVEHLYRMSRIYAHILYRLCSMPAPIQS